MWYSQFLSFIEDEKANPTTRSGRKLVKEASLGGFTSDGLWTVPMNKLQDALDASWAKLKTPLLIDTTAEGGSGEPTPLEVFFSYSGDRILDLKRIVIEVDVKKTKSREQALEEMRAKLVLSMRRGYFVVFMMGNAAPKLRSRFTSAAHLPFVLLDDNAEVQRVIGGAEDWRKVDWSRELIKESDDIYTIHRDFNVLAVTQFAPDSYREFLSKELPLSSMQHIQVTRSEAAAHPQFWGRAQQPGQRWTSV